MSAEVPAGGQGAAAPTAVVVGGGVSGLVAARELALSGARVVLLEASGRLGGILSRGRVGGVLVDLGAESMLARRPEGTDLARELGLAEHLVSPQARQAQVWRAGRAHPLPAGTVMGVPSDAAALGGLLDPAEVDATRRAMHASAEVEPVAGDVSVREHVAAQLGPAVVDVLVEPLLGGVYAGRTDRLSLAATIPALWRAAQDGVPLVRAVRDAAARVPAGGGGPVFAGLDTGMAGLVEALAADLERRGVDVRLGTRAVGLHRLPGGSSSPRRPVGSRDDEVNSGTDSGRGSGDGRGGADRWGRWRVQPAGGAPLRADLVVVALPATQAARLLRGPVPAAADELSAVECTSVAVVALAVPSAELADVPGSGLLVPPTEGRRAGLDVKAVTFSGAKWRWVAEQDPGVAVVRASVGRRGEPGALQQDDDGLVRTVVRDLQQLLVPGRPTLPVVDAVVARWGGALPQYDVGHLDRVARLRSAVAAAPGLGVAGSALDGVGVPACIATARRAVTDALAGAH